MAVTLLIVLFSLVVYFSLFLKKSRAEKIKEFPGPTRFPIIGNIWYFGKSEDVLKNLTNLQRDYGNRVGLSGGLSRGFVLFHPGDVEKILASRETIKSSLYNMAFTDWLGASFFYAKIKEHFKKRKILTPPFDFKHVGNFELHSNEHSKTLVNAFKSIEAAGIDTEIRELLTLCVLNNSLDYFVGKRREISKDLDSSYATAVHKQLPYVSQRILSPWLWSDLSWKMSTLHMKERQTRKVIHEFMGKVVQDRKKELNLTIPEKQSLVRDDGFEKKEKLNLLDHLIREQQLGNPDVSDKYIRDEVNALVFAAHDTVASSLVFTIYLLATHPSEQAKIHEELDEVFGEDKGRYVSYADLSKLKHLECCIKEALRMFPPAPVMLRLLEKDIQIDKETTIPKGSEVVLCPWVSHRLPEFWLEPEKFKPMRFLPENSAGRHPYCYIPFAAGPRNCMGQKLAMAEEKIILSHLFRNFTIELAETCPPVIPMGDVVIFPKDELKIKLKMR